MEDPSTQEENTDKEERLSRTRTWLRRLVALGIWTSMFLSLRGVRAPFGENPYGILGAVLLTILISLFAFSGVPTFVAYVITFPVWAPLGILYWCVRLLRIPSRMFFNICNKLAQIYRSPIAAALHFPASLTFIVIINFASDYMILRACSAVLILITIDMVFMAFFVIPSLALAKEILRLAPWFLKDDRIESSVFSRRLRAWPDDKEINRAANQLEFYSNGARWLSGIFDKLISVRAIVASFIGLFILTFLFVTLNFGAVFLASWRLDKSFFGCAPISPNFLDSEFFSITSITTSGLSQLCPSSGLAKLLVSSELICGLTVLSVLGIAFATLHLVNIEEFRGEWAYEMARADERTGAAEKILELLPDLAKEGAIPDPEEVRKEAANSQRSVEQVWIEMVNKASQSALSSNGKGNLGTVDRTSTPSQIFREPEPKPPGAPPRAAPRRRGRR